MSVLYADTSALVRLYLPDEIGHEELSRLFMDGEDPVVTSELSRLELTSILTSASRAGRLSDPAAVLARFDVDCSDEGPLSLVRLNPVADFPAAQRLLVAHRLRTLAALHLAVVLEEVRPLAGGERVVVVTADEEQAEAAKAIGLEVNHLVITASTYPSAGTRQEAADRPGVTPRA